MIRRTQWKRLAAFRVVRADYWLIIIPLAFLALCFIVGKTGFYPIYSNPLGYDQDPAYVYLYSGLTFLHGKIPHHVDHPGTTLQIFLSILILLGYLSTSIASPSMSWGGLVSQDSLDAFVYNHTESLMVASGVLTCSLIAFLTYLLARKVYKYFESLPAALFSQLFLFSWGNGILSNGGPDLIILRAIYPAPEAMLIIFTLAGLTFLTSFVAKSSFDTTNLSQNEQDRSGCSIGIIASFGLFTKVTFIPFLPLLFIVQGASLKKALKYFLGTSLLMALIIVSRLRGLARWLYGNLTHVGRYGSGEAGMVDSNNFPEFLQIISPIQNFAWAPLLLIVTMLAVIGLRQRDFGQGRRISDYELRHQSLVNDNQNVSSLSRYSLRGMARTYMLLGVSLALGLLILLKSPSPHYFVATIVIIYFISSVTIGLLESIARSSDDRHRMFVGSTVSGFRIVLKLVFPATLGFAAMAIITSLALVPNLVQISRTNFVNLLSSNDHFLLKDKYYCTYRIPTKRCSIGFGLSYNPHLTGKRLYSDLYWFNIWGGSFANYGYSGDQEAGSRWTGGKLTIATNKKYLKVTRKFFDGNGISLSNNGSHYQLWQSRFNK